MPKIRAENLVEHQALSWNAILGGLEDLLCRRSFAELTLAEIAAAAGMARNTLYNYAADKNELLAAAAERTSIRLFDEVEEIAALPIAACRRLERIMTTVLNWFTANEHRHIVLHSLALPAQPTVQARAVAPLMAMFSHVDALLLQGAEDGSVRRLADVSLTSALIEGFMSRAIARVTASPDNLAGIEAEILIFLRGALEPVRRSVSSQPNLDHQNASMQAG